MAVNVLSAIFTRMQEGVFSLNIVLKYVRSVLNSHMKH